MGELRHFSPMFSRTFLCAWSSMPGRHNMIISTKKHRESIIKWVVILLLNTRKWSNQEVARFCPRLKISVHSWFILRIEDADMYVRLVHRINVWYTGSMFGTQTFPGYRLPICASETFTPEDLEREKGMRACYSERVPQTRSSSYIAKTSPANGNV